MVGKLVQTCRLTWDHKVKTDVPEGEVDLGNPRTELEGTWGATAQDNLTQLEMFDKAVSNFRKKLVALEEMSKEGG